MQETFNRSNISNFYEKSILSSSFKKINIFDETTGKVDFSTEEQEIKTKFVKDGISIIGSSLYSEHILAIQEKKSFISYYRTNLLRDFLGSSPIDDEVTAIDTSCDNRLVMLGTAAGKFYIYELNSGNLLFHLEIGVEKIIKVKFLNRDGSIILILSSAYLKLFLLDE